MAAFEAVPHGRALKKKVQALRGVVHPRMSQITLCKPLSQQLSSDENTSHQKTKPFILDFKEIHSETKITVFVNFTIFEASQQHNFFRVLKNVANSTNIKNTRIMR